jgi:SAM-dependent methyltransferase
VLDVGSGAGEFLIETASSVEDIRAVGIDVSEAMVAVATSRAREAGVSVEFRLGDAQRLDFPDATPHWESRQFLVFIGASHKGIGRGAPSNTARLAAPTSFPFVPTQPDRERTRSGHIYTDQPIRA